MFRKILELILVISLTHLGYAQKLEIMNLHEDPILLVKLKPCKIQTGSIKIVHPINISNLELTVESLNKIVKNKLNDKLELHNIVEHKYIKLVNNLRQIKPTQSTRHKRWDELGSAWKWLAGNPDAQDLRIINRTMNDLINENNQQLKINEQINKRIQLITDTVNRALINTTIANRVILTEIEMMATIINLDMINTILEDIQDAIIKTKLELPSNKILTLKEIIMIKDILTNQGINITLPDEALQYVIPKIATNKDTLLYILQIPKLEEEESTMMTIIPLVINNTVIGNYPQHLVKSNQKLFVTSDHNSFVQKHSNIKEFRDKCIKPLIMGTQSLCNVTTETDTTIQYIAEDKILINNAKNENLYSDCGPNNRTITGNFIINFWNCTITFNNKKFHSFEIRSEIQVIQGTLHNVEATRKLIPELNIDVIQQENIENRRKIEHVYLRQANHQTWIWTLTGGISASSIGIILLIIIISIRKKGTKITIQNSPVAKPNPEQTTGCSEILKKYGIKPKTEDALSSPLGGVTLS